MSTHNICFRREIRKVLCGYPLLSVAMTSIYIIRSQLKIRSFLVFSSKKSIDIFLISIQKTYIVGTH